MLYALLTVIATVWGGRILRKDSETLTFAVGAPDGNEARFAAKLASLLKSTKSRLRLKILASSDNAKALAQFDRCEADLAVLRTDAKIPPRAQVRVGSTEMARFATSAIVSRTSVAARSSRSSQSIRVRKGLRMSRVAAR